MDEVEKSGYILLHRSFLKWGWYSDSLMVHLFIHLILTANDEGNKRGQLITSKKHLAEDLGTTDGKIRTALNRLQKSGAIKVDTTGKYTVITVVNYGLYQGD